MRKDDELELEAQLVGTRYESGLQSALLDAFELEDELDLEQEALELEPLFVRRAPQRQALFETATPARRPAPNAVDPEAAEPIFSGRVRTPEAPLLDTARLATSSRWNKATHPRVSGIGLKELCARLERYIDRAALDDHVRRTNAAAPGSYGSDDATLVTLLAHQFQRKTCRTPTVGEITKPCTVDGRVAEDTLDTLGFVYHTGETLNRADQINRVAADTLRKLPASAFAGIEPGLTASTWWSHMVSPPWLGMPIKQGIHLVLLKRLRRAQSALMSLPAYANLSPAELGKALGLEEEHKGARPGNADWSMHLFGLAIDIGYTRNPWLTNPRRDTAKLAAITLRAARLVGPSRVGDAGITARYLHNLATTHRDTDKIHKILAGWSGWLDEYFALVGNAKRLESLLPLATAIYPDAGWFKPGESLAAAANRWTRLVRTDFDDFALAVSRGSNKNEVRHGFMDLASDLVIALRNEACLAWGAVDFGPSASGDVMHFDLRTEGIGRTIGKASGKAFVPVAGHPCLPAGGGPSGQREFEQPAKLPNSPVGRVLARQGVRVTIEKPTIGHWLGKSTAGTNVIKKYNDAGGKPQETDYAIHVSSLAWMQKDIDLLVFFHGDPGPCSATFDPDPNSDRKFGLDKQIDGARRKIVLVVPRLFWKVGDSANILGVWTAAKFNEFVDEVVSIVQLKSGLTAKPNVARLIIAGHSHAYAILTPFACEFNQDAEATKKGALAKLTEVWALDTTYGCTHVHGLEAWAYKRPTLQVSAVLSTNKDEARKPFKSWNEYFGATTGYCPRGFVPPNNLKMIEAPEKHCELPSKYIGRLLSAVPP